jgi:hypothetical protein
MSDKLKALLIAVVSALLAAVVTYMSTGQTPDPVDITCEVAREVIASDACQAEPETPPVEEEEVVEEEPVEEEAAEEEPAEEVEAPE